MKKILTSLFLLVFVTGCASVPKQSFNKEANKNIKTISLVNAPTVEEVSVDILHHPGTSFGFLGGLVAMADIHAKTTVYNEAVKANKVDWNAYAQQQIKSALEQSGYQVALLDARKKEDAEKRDHLEKYPDVNTDAILDYYFGVGHLATGPTTPYVPSVMLSARMIKSSDKSVIYEDQFTAGNVAVAGKSVQLGAGTNSYKNITELESKPGESMGDLKLMVNKVAQRIGQDLKK